jgi:AraC-like DNA-binding protein
MNLRIPKDVIHASFPRMGDRQGLTIDPNHEALRLMKSYLHFLDGCASPFSQSISDHITGTIIDLLGLATGAKGNEAELAGLRGLRAARLQAILGYIRTNHAQPGLSAELVGRKLGLSARYVQDLLATTGSSFSERVLELRLQHAKQMLINPCSMGMRISEIVYASGFGDISYFNRCFRRRFGCSPGVARL